MAERRSGLSQAGPSVAVKLAGQAQEKQRLAQSSGRGRPGNSGPVGQDSAGRSKGTYDISLETQERIRNIAEAEGVVISDLVELAMAAFCTVYESGRVDLHPLKRATRNLKADWKLEVPYEISFFG